MIDQIYSNDPNDPNDQRDSMVDFNDLVRDQVNGDTYSQDSQDYSSYDEDSD